MSNSNEFLNDMEFDKMVKEKGDRDLLEFISQQVYEQKKETMSITKKVKENSERSRNNRLLLILLVVSLVSLGVLDSGILNFIGF